jgi:hypothetical protein
MGVDFDKAKLALKGQSGLPSLPSIEELDQMTKDEDITGENDGTVDDENLNEDVSEGEALLSEEEDGEIGSASDSEDADIPVRQGIQGIADAEEGETISMEPVPGGSAMVRDSDKPDESVELTAKRRTLGGKKGSDSVVQIRDFPRAVMELARAEFPGAGSMADALTAYVIVKSGRAVKDIPDSAQELLDAYKGNDTLLSMDERMAHMEKQMHSIIGVLCEIEVGVAYSVFDRLGFRKDNAPSPVRTDFLEDGMHELMRRLQEQGRQWKQQEARRTGRPQRGKGGDGK